MDKQRQIFLAYDQGLEHGPTDFNLVNIDPKFVIRLAEISKIDGIILQPGVAEKYFSKQRVQLIIKLNGKTRLREGDPVSYQHCSIDRALRLGAKAVGFTLYPGSAYEPVNFQQFGRVVEKAHKLHLPVIAWVYPRGKGVDENSTENIAYAARIALELGADFCKIHYNWDFEGFKWACKAAGNCKVLVVGGQKSHELKFLQYVKEAMDAGAAGIAVGRNVWQYEKPAKMLAAVKAIVYRDKTPSQAMNLLH